MTNSFLLVTPPPHLKDKTTTSSIMLDVLIALIPAGIFGVYSLGSRALLVILVCILGSVLTEYLLQVSTKRNITIKDLSATVTGLLLAYNLPPAIPLWIAFVGSVFAILVVKFIFGGIGKNIVNPALAARAFLLAAYPVAMTTFTIDGIASPTPLVSIAFNTGSLPTFSQLLIGDHAGCIGEVSVIGILIGALYLLFKKVITLHVPFAYIGTSALLLLIINRSTTVSDLYELLLGGLLLGAFFMATDYTTSPITPTGKIIFGIGCGVITVLIRVYGSYTEGVSYSILLMNLTVPLIDKFTKSKVFGVTGGAK